MLFILLNLVKLVDEILNLKDLTISHHYSYKALKHRCSLNGFLSAFTFFHKEQNRPWADVIKLFTVVISYLIKYLCNVSVITFETYL